jgi:DNA-directed RNA polymerase subunit RPC12/RpoP
MSEINTNCPTCGNQISMPTDQGPKVACPYCDARIYVKKALQEQKRQDKVDDLLNVAGNFRVLCFLLIFVALLATVFGLAQAGSIAFAIAGSCFSTAFIFYIICQILHIRANTLR